MKIDITRLNVKKVMKVADKAMKVSKDKSESERRHSEWVRGACSELYKLYKEMCKDFGFMNNWTLDQFTDRMDEMLASLKVDVNAKNYLRSKFMMELYEGSFAKNHLTQDQWDENWELQQNALEAINKYDIPHLSKFCNNCDDYRFWRDHWADELRRDTAMQSILTRAENELNDMIHEMKERQNNDTRGY